MARNNQGGLQVKSGQQFWTGRNNSVGARSADVLGQVQLFRRHRLAPMDHLYIESKDGEVYELSATSALTQLAENEMKEVIMGHARDIRRSCDLANTRPCLRHGQ